MNRPISSPWLQNVRVSQIAITKATTGRNEAVVHARDLGATWREIATAAGMTEMGVRKIYERQQLAAHGRK